MGVETAEAELALQQQLGLLHPSLVEEPELPDGTETKVSARSATS